MYKTIYLFHDQEGTTNGTVLTLELLLRRMYPELDYVRPMLIHQDSRIVPEEAYADIKRAIESIGILPGALIIGLGVGGLLAAKLLEDFPELNLTVIAISSPTRVGLFTLKPDLHENLISLYSSQDDFIFEATNWPDYTSQSFDVLWLRDHRIEKHKYSITRVLESYLNGDDIHLAVRDVFPYKGEGWDA